MTRPWRAPRAAAAPGFAEFVSARGGPMLSMARGLVRSDADAQDLVQDVLAKALLKWDTVRRADDPAAYVNRMLVNAGTSFWRRGARRETATDAGGVLARVDQGAAWTTTAPAADPAERVADREALLQALRALPPRHRAVLVLRYVEGVPDTEIADLLGVAQATVRSSAARGLAALRRDGVLADRVDTTTTPGPRRVVAGP